MFEIGNNKNFDLAQNTELNSDCQNSQTCETKGIKKTTADSFNFAEYILSPFKAAGSNIATGLNAAFMSAIAEPGRAIGQIVDHLTNKSTNFNQLAKDGTTFVGAGHEEQADFASLKWHAQQIGAAAGMMLPFMAVRSAVKSSINGLSKGLSSQGAKRTESLINDFGADAQTISPRLAAISAKEAMLSGTSGFVYGNLFTPGEDKNIATSSFWQERLINGLGDFAVFGTIGAFSPYSKKMLDSSSAYLDSYYKNNLLSATLRTPFTAGMLSGLPAGYVSAHVESIKSGKQEELTWTEIGKSMYGMAFVGGAFAQSHWLAAHRQGTDKTNMRYWTDRSLERLGKFSEGVRNSNNFADFNKIAFQTRLADPLVETAKFKILSGLDQASILYDKLKNPVSSTEITSTFNNSAELVVRQEIKGFWGKLLGENFNPYAETRVLNLKHSTDGRPLFNSDIGLTGLIATCAPLEAPLAMRDVFADRSNLGGITEPVFMNFDSKNNLILTRGEKESRVRSSENGAFDSMAKSDINDRQEPVKLGIEAQGVGLHYEWYRHFGSEPDIITRALELKKGDFYEYGLLNAIVRSEIPRDSANTGRTEYKTNDEATRESRKQLIGEMIRNGATSEQLLGFESYLKLAEKLRPETLKYIFDQSKEDGKLASLARFIGETDELAASRIAMIERLAKQKAIARLFDRHQLYALEKLEGILGLESKTLQYLVEQVEQGLQLSNIVHLVENDPKGRRKTFLDEASKRGEPAKYFESKSLEAYLDLIEVFSPDNTIPEFLKRRIRNDSDLNMIAMSLKYDSPKAEVKKSYEEAYRDGSLASVWKSEDMRALKFLKETFASQPEVVDALLLAARRKQISLDEIYGRMTWGQDAYTEQKIIDAVKNGVRGRDFADLDLGSAPNQGYLKRLSELFGEQSSTFQYIRRRNERAGLYLGSIVSSLERAMDLSTKQGEEVKAKLDKLVAEGANTRQLNEFEALLGLEEKLGVDNPIVKKWWNLTGRGLDLGKIDYFLSNENLDLARAVQAVEKLISLEPEIKKATFHLDEYVRLQKTFEDSPEIADYLLALHKKDRLDTDRIVDSIEADSSGRVKKIVADLARRKAPFAEFNSKKLAEKSMQELEPVRTVESFAPSNKELRAYSFVDTAYEPNSRIGKILQNNRNSVYRIVVETTKKGDEYTLPSVGSGVMVDGKGYMLTAAHVIENAGKIWVVAQGGKAYEAKIEGVELSSDLALLKVQAPKSESQFNASNIANSRTVLEKGESLFVLGHPDGDWRLNHSNLKVQGYVPYFNVLKESKISDGTAMVVPGSVWSQFGVAGFPIGSLEGVSGLSYLGTKRGPSIFVSADKLAVPSILGVTYGITPGGYSGSPAYNQHGHIAGIVVQASPTLGTSTFTPIEYAKPLLSKIPGWLNSDAASSGLGQRHLFGIRVPYALQRLELFDEIRNHIR